MLIERPIVYPFFLLYLIMDKDYLFLNILWNVDCEVQFLEAEVQFPLQGSMAKQSKELV